MFIFFHHWYNVTMYDRNKQGSRCSGSKTVLSLFFRRMAGLWQSLQSSASLCKVTYSLCLWCRWAFACAFILSLLCPTSCPPLSRSSESCLKMCPIHLSLLCCTVSTMFLFSCTFCRTFLLASMSTQLIFSILFQTRISKLIVFLCQPGSSSRVSAPQGNRCLRKSFFCYAGMYV